MHNPSESVGAGLRRRPGRLALRVRSDAPRRGVRRGRDRPCWAARSGRPSDDAGRAGRRTAGRSRAALVGRGGARACRPRRRPRRRRARRGIPRRLDARGCASGRATPRVGLPRPVPRRPRPGTNERPDDRHHRHGRQDDDSRVPRGASAQEPAVGSPRLRPPAPGTSGRPPSSWTCQTQTSSCWS